MASGRPYSDPSKAVRPNSLDELRRELHKIYSYDEIVVEYVQRFMELYEGDRAQWEKYVKTDPNEPTRYTRNLIDEGNGKFNLMLLCWPQSSSSKIHDHANSHCFLKVLEGTVKEELYDWPEEGTKMKLRATNEYLAPQCSYMNDKLGVHRIQNPSDSQLTVTLHLYSPPFSQCNCIDENTSAKQEVDVTFFSKHGQLTKSKPTGTCSSCEKK